MTAIVAEGANLSPYVDFTREEWAGLGADLPVTLSHDDLHHLQGVNEEVSLAEVADIYVPLARLLSLHVEAAQSLHHVTETFLGGLPAKAPYVIGVAGSVAAGKSTTSRILREVLARWPNHPSVDLITTDGFLYPNAELQQRGLMARKGFPESYDVRRLLQFVAQLKSGTSPLHVPVYSHLRYDILPDRVQTIIEPDIVIIEGLNVLQTGADSRVFLSDYFDFSIYVDAPVPSLRDWYVDRFATLRETVFQDAQSYFNRYADLSAEEAEDMALSIWTSINEKNLRDNILPTRERASLILEKGEDHAVTRVRLRRL